MSFDIDILFKIAGIGIAIALLNQILNKAGRDEEAMMVTLAGIIIVLAIVVKMISEFFDAVKVFMTF
ncbi:MAG: stage III sporulation protein AC [Firmicutes bacterium]|nr:stage III sporulation protein AC [Bacillota bacterium]